MKAAMGAWGFPYLGCRAGARCYIVGRTLPPLPVRAQVQSRCNSMPKVPVARQSPRTGARGPSLPRILLDDAPGGLKASNSRVLGVGVEDSGTGDVGAVDGQGDGGLTGAQRGDGRDTHNCLGISPMSVSRALGAGGPRPSLALPHPSRPPSSAQPNTGRALPTSRTGTRHLSQSP